MDDEHRRGYRDPAPPAPLCFPVRLATTARVGLSIGVGSIVLSVALVLLTGRFVFIAVAALGPSLFHLLSGAPRMVEVHHDSVVIRSWLRAPMRLAASEVEVHRREHDLLFVGGGTTLSIAAAHFPGDSLDRCVDALRETDALVSDERR